MTAAAPPEQNQSYEPRPRARAVLFAVGLVVLALESRLTNVGLVQVGTALVLWVVGHTVATALAPQPVDARLARLTWNRGAPVRVVVPALLLFLVLGFLGLTVVVNFRLGIGFAFWFIGFAGDVSLRLALRKHVDKGALLVWKPVNPVRQALVAGTVVLPVVIALPMVIRGEPIRNALLAAGIVALFATPAAVVLAALSRPRED